MTKMLSAEAILAVNDLVEEVVEVPEWAGAVRVRAFTKALQQQMREEARIGGEVQNDRLEILMLIYGMVEPQFTPEQCELLRRKHAGALDRVLDRILTISGLKAEAVEVAKRKFPAGA